MGITINSRILLSIASIAAAAALIVGATFAFFTDTETSEDNVFAAGELDLKVDYDCYYNIVANGQPNCPFEPNTWELTDLGLQHKFFDFDDVKPGDFGEGTISLHVFDNDAWGWFSVDETDDSDVTCTEPESEDPDDPECVLPSPVPGNGELQEALLFSVWLDQGETPGFQGTEDFGEGDNIFNDGDVPLASPGPIDNGGENYNLWQVLAPIRAALDESGACNGTDSDGDGQTDEVDGNGLYLACQGLAVDGRLVGSTTYYFGVAWELPETVGDEVQSDNFVSDVIFRVEQHRNNPSPSPLPLNNP